MRFLLFEGVSNFMEALMNILFCPTTPSV